MRIKTKLNLGIGLLFTLIVLLAYVTIKQINSLAQASNNIIKDNKETISHTQSMLKALSEIENESSINTFEKHLIKQRFNITEAGEKELTQKLSEKFAALKKNKEDKTLLTEAQSYLFEIMEHEFALLKNP